MRLTTIVVLLAAGTISWCEQARTFQGRITDTMCGERHGMVKGQPDDACVHACVKGTSSVYGLYDGKTVLRLSDQKTPARFVGQAVKVTGSLNEKTHTIKVASIEPAD